MVRLRIFGSGLVLLTDEDGKVLERFIVPDPEKAQETVMKFLQERNSKESDKHGR